MKIKEVKAYPVSYQIEEPFASATGWKKSRGVILVEVITDEGVSGWGEALGPLTTIAEAIEKDLAPIVIDEDPLDVGVLWEKMQIRRLKGTPSSAIGGIDMALWDLKGRILNVPVYQLIGGGFHKQLQPYATALFYHEDDWDSVKELEKEARSILELGFKAIKMKVGLGVERDIKRVSKLREIVGDDFPIMVDANQSYGFKSALELGFALKDLGVKWFEEPLPWVSLSAYRELGERLNLTIAGGEVETSLMGFVEALKQNAVQIIQPDPAFAGGITPCIHVASLAKAYEVDFHPHSFGTLIGLAASIHLTAGVAHYAAWTPVQRPVLLEWDAIPNLLKEKIIAEGPVAKDGLVDVPNKPGLGIEVDRDAIEKFSI